jgi:hypothetical protein
VIEASVADGSTSSLFLEEIGQRRPWMKYETLASAARKPHLQVPRVILDVRATEYLLAFQRGLWPAIEIWEMTGPRERRRLVYSNVELTPVAICPSQMVARETPDGSAETNSGLTKAFMKELDEKSSLTPRLSKGVEPQRQPNGQDSKQTSFPTR